MYNVRIIYHFVLCSFRMRVVVLTGPTSSPGRIKRAEFSGPPLPSAGDHSTHTYTALVHPAATPTHTPGSVRVEHYIIIHAGITFLGSQTGTTMRRWTPRGLHASPAKHPSDFFLLLLSRHLYYYIKLYVYGPGVVFVRFRSPLGKAAAATAVCRALDACACARAHPPVAV